MAEMSGLTSVKEESAPPELYLEVLHINGNRYK